MSIESTSMALIPYTPPKTPMEFIRSEVEKGLAAGTISLAQLTLHPSISPSLSLDCINLNLSAVAKTFSRISDAQENPLLNRRIDGQLHSLNGRSIFTNFEMPTFSSNHSMTRFRLLPFESFDLLFDDVHATSSVASAQQLNGEEIAEALQAEAAFTIATDKKPIVATYGAGPCVALGGYDATNKIAFMVHFSNAGEVRNSGGLIFYNISKLAKEKIEKPIQLHLRGGIEGQSEATIAAIKMWMKQRDDLPMEITTQDILASGMGGGKSLLIDARTGEVSEYHPLANSKRRDMSQLDVMSAMMSAYQPKIKLAYSPK